MKEKRKGESILSGTLALTASTLLIKFLGVIYKIPLAGYLGDEGMGYFNCAYTIFSFFYLICTAGVPKAVMILSSKAKAEGKREEEQRLVTNTLFAFFSLGLVFSVGLAVGAPLFSRLIGSGKAAMTVLAVSPSVLFVSVSGVLRGRLSADMRFSDIAISGVIEAISRLLFGLAFARLGIELKMSAPLISAFTVLGVTLGAFFSLLYLYICYKKTKPKVKIGQKVKYKTLGLSDLKKVFRISMPITLSAAVMSLTNIIDLSLIMRGLSSIGYSESRVASLYGNYTTLSVSMLNLAIALVAPISVAFLPVLTKAHTLGDREGFLTAIKSSLSFSFLISAPITLGLSFYSREALMLLFPNSEYFVGARLLLYLLPSVFFYSALLTVNSALEASGDVKAPMISVLLGSLVKLLFGLVFVRNPDVGILSAPIGTTLSYLTALIVSLIRLERKAAVRIPIFSTALPSHLFALMPLLLTYPLYFYLKEEHSESFSFLSVCVAVAFLYLIFCFLFYFLPAKKRRKMAKYTNFPLKN